MQVLTSRGLAGALAPRLVTGESIAQAYQFVATGNAEIGFVALSQLRVPGKSAGGSMWLVPQNLHHELKQDAVLLRAGSSSTAARELLAFLKSEAAQKLIRDHGYGLPGP
jgi:molybdate transport system substrate-binding protein